MYVTCCMWESGQTYTLSSGEVTHSSSAGWKLHSSVMGLQHRVEWKGTAGWSRAVAFGMKKHKMWSSLIHSHPQHHINKKVWQGGWKAHTVPMFPSLIQSLNAADAASMHFSTMLLGKKTTIRELLSSWKLSSAIAYIYTSRPCVGLKQFLCHLFSIAATTTLDRVRD